MERGQKPEQVIRSILFRVEHDHYVMVLVAGPMQISWPALRAYLKQSRLTLASKEEVFDVTGYQLGSVSPFGIGKPVRILADKSIFAQDEISIGSGERYTTIIMKKTDLVKALGVVETGDFLTPPAS